MLIYFFSEKSKTKKYKRITFKHKKLNHSGTLCVEKENLLDETAKTHFFTKFQFPQLLESA